MEINCEFGIRSLNGETIYCCFVTEANIFEGHTHIKAFKGKHLHGKKDKDVEALIFTNTKVERLPKILPQIFPSLKYLEITNCGLSSLKNDDLRGNFVCLRLDGNNLGYSNIEDNAFYYMDYLKMLTIRGFDLRYYHLTKAFEYLKGKLELFDLRPNTAGPDKFGRLIRSEIDTNFIKPIDNSHCEAFQKDMCEGFKELLTSESHSDFTIAVQEKQFKVHKILLATRSSVFSAMFEKDMIENTTSSMKMEDFTADAFEEFLRYLYTGDRPKETHAMELFALASKYDVSNLRLLCEKDVLKNIDESNAFEVLNLGKLYGSQEMTQLALTEAVKLFPQYNIPDNLATNQDAVEKLIAINRLRDENMKRINENVKRINEEFQKNMQDLFAPDGETEVEGSEAKKLKLDQPEIN